MSFKYENLSNFCFGFGRMGYGLKDCCEIALDDKGKLKEELPYSLALKVKSNLMGK